MSDDRSITALKNKYAGQDLFVLGSGASMDYHPPEFFSDRIAIGCNSVYRRFPVKYTVAKELSNRDLMESSAAGAIPVISRHAYGNKNYPAASRDIDAEHYIFDHPPNRHTAVDWEVIGTDELVVSYSTITSAIHLAAYMGAKLILLCGADAGTLDGKINYTGYGAADPTPGQTDWYVDFIRQMRGQTVTLRDKLQEVYGCHICTLSPFVNLAHEGHEFQSCATSNQSTAASASRASGSSFPPEPAQPASPAKTCKKSSPASPSSPGRSNSINEPSPESPSSSPPKTTTPAKSR